MTSFDLYRLRLGDHVTILNHFVKLEESCMFLKARRVIGIYVMNLSLYDVEIASKLNSKKNNMRKLEPIPRNIKG